jgi:hypothetical protein
MEESQAQERAQLMEVIEKTMHDQDQNYLKIHKMLGDVESPLQGTALQMKLVLQNH